MKTLVEVRTLPILFAIVAVSIGATYALSQTTDNFDVQKSGANILGHVEVIVSDENGFVKAYRQSDNAIVKHGMAIIASQVFSDFNYTSGTVGHMEIGTGGETAAAPYQSGLVSAQGCARQNVAFSNMSAVNSGGFAQISVNGSATFQGSDCADTSIDEAGAFTSLAGGHMFARNVFNDVDLETSDQLTLNWDFVFTDS